MKSIAIILVCLIVGGGVFGYIYLRAGEQANQKLELTARKAEAAYFAKCAAQRPESGKPK